MDNFQNGTAFTILLVFSLYAKVVVSACPSTWNEKDGSCIKVFTSTSLKWGEAETSCNGHNHSHLIYLNGRTISFLKGLTDFENFVGIEYHVGGKKTSGQWRWGDGVLVKISDIAIQSGEYLLIRGWENTLKFFPTDVNHASKYICEFSQLSSTAGSSSSINALSSSSQQIAASPSVSSSSSSASTSSSSSPQPTAVSVTPSSATSSSAPSPSLSPTSSSSLLSSSTLPPSPSSSIYTKTDKNTTIFANGVAKFLYHVRNTNITDPASLEETVNSMQDLLSAVGENTTSEALLQASKELEYFALRYTDHHLNGTEILIHRQNIVLLATNVFDVHKNFTLSMPDVNGTSPVNTIVIPADNLNKEGTSIVVIYYRNLDVLMDRFKAKEERYSTKSNIIAIVMKPLLERLIKNVTLGFQINDTKRSIENICAFWDFTQQTPGWSRDGCSVATETKQYVECSCNHLTHFAVLMKTDDQKLSKTQDRVLTILTYIGLTASIAGCVLTFFAYWLLTDTKSQQTQIRMNLVFFLAVAHVLFLLNSTASKNTVVCVTVAALTQFFYTAAMCWMFAEGIQLYQQIVKVFNTELEMKKVYGFALGFPSLLIICSLSIAGSDSHGITSFVSQDLCWLSVKNHLIWVFIAPVFLLILANLVILAMVMKEMARINKTTGDSTRGSSLRSEIKGFTFLAPLLGITWLTGLLCILGAGIVGLYVFTILNSTQGVFIFVFHCFRNSEIRGKLKREIKVMDESRLKQLSSRSPHSNRTLMVQYKRKEIKSAPQHLAVTDFDHDGLAAKTKLDE